MQFSHALIALVAAGLANAQFPNLPSCSVRDHRQLYIQNVASNKQ